MCIRDRLDTHQRGQGESDTTKPSDWLQAGGWLAEFYKDVQELLLAELDVRLQPVLGLLEALNSANS